MAPKALMRRGAGAAADFWRGAADPWRALRFLVVHPRLWIWAFIPFAMCLAIYFLIFYFGWSHFEGWLDHGMLHAPQVWRRVVAYALVVLFWVVGVIAAALAFIPVASLIANPFNDILSEKTELIYRGAPERPFSIGHMLRTLRIGLAGEVARFATVGFLLGLAWTLNFIPLLGPPTAAGASALITIMFVSLEYTSFSMDRRLYTWTMKKRFLRERRPRTLGFGAMTFLILMTPVVNALFIPVSAVAGTLLFCDTEIDGDEIASPERQNARE